YCFFFSSRRRHTRFSRDWSSDVCSSDLYLPGDTEMAKRLGEPEQAYVSRYALGRDYHKLIRKRLQSLAERVQALIGPFGYRAFRSEERRVGKECRCGWEQDHGAIAGKRT